jgi:toxin ParE1/3/4
MAKVILRQEAINDLNEIWLYTFEKWSEKQADKYYSLLEYTCLEIGNNAELGKEYNGVETSLFGLKTAKHIIFYRIITKQEIEIIRILHERMDLKNSFD